jgi:O-antigen/teichoic acid export membrane protein
MLRKRAASFWLNAMFYTMLQRVSLFVFGVAGYMILVRGFNKPHYGVWALYLTIFALFEAIKQGLIRNSSIKFMGLSENHFRKDAVQTSSLFVNTLFSLLIIAGIFAFGDWISRWLNTPDLQELLLLSTINIILLIFFNHCEILLQFQYRFDTLFMSAFLRQAFFLAGLLIMYFFLRDQFTLVNVLIIQIIALLIALVYIVNKCSAVLLRRFTYNSALTMQFFNFGKYTFGTNLFSGFSRSFDHFVTASALGPLQGKIFVAYYNTVARINNMIDVPSLAAADVLYPKNVEALEKEGPAKVKYYFEQVTGTILAFIVPLSLFVFIFPRLIIYIIAGSDYYPAIPILQLTILFSMVRPLSYQFGSTLDAVGKPEINFLANTFLMLLNFFLTYFFLKLYGGIGAAYATVIYYLVSLSLMIFVLKKYIDIDARNILRIALGRYTQIFDYVVSLRKEKKKE